MLFHVQTVSTQIIKPSSPTPQHLQTLQLSSLDQAAPQIYTSIILFYSTDTITYSTDQIPIKLKTSLSETLSYFYPLAGRIKLSPMNTLQVDCNDEGVEFVEANTETDFDSFLLDPPINQFEDLLPIKVTEFRWKEDPLLAVQLNMFKGGEGLALGVSMSHLIADGASMALFLNSWADVAKGINLISSRMPKFDAASAFPPQSKLANRPMPDQSSSSDDSVVIKRFVVPGKSIQMLRKGGGGNNNPTRVEAVSALVWRCLNRMRQNRSGSMMTSVNLRSKMPASASLSECSFGNLWISVVATAEENLRSSVRRVDEDYARNREKVGWEVEGLPVDWIYSSWCRIPLYRSDFGWGNAVWLGCGIKDMKDACILIDTSDGEGVEVWLWLARQEMAIIERDQEFTMFVSR